MVPNDLIEFKIINEIPKDLAFGAADRAIIKFIVDSTKQNVPLNRIGYMEAILETIVSALIFKNPNIFIWLAKKDNGEVASFAITSYVQKDVDNSPTYILSKAWVDKEYRFTDLPKKWFQQMCEHGKSLKVKHMLIPTGRGVAGYLRYIGKPWHYYCSILKMDI